MWILLFLTLLASPALAQTTATNGAIVISSCSGADIFVVGRAAPLTVEADGTLCTNGGGGGSGGTSSNFGSAFPPTGTAAGFNDGTNMQGTKVFDLDSGAGSDYNIGVTPRISASGGSVPQTSQAAGADNVSNTYAAFLGASLGYYFDGSTWDRVRGDSTDGALVNLGTNNDVTVTGTVSGTGTAGSAATGVLTVQGIASMTPISVVVNAGTTGATPIPQVPAVSTVSTTITRPSDTNAYAANDAFSNSTSAPTSGGFTFTSACRASGGYGTITDAVVSASAGTAYQGELWIYDQAATNINDNSAFTSSDSDVQNLVGVIPFQTTDTTAANAISYVTGLNIGYTCVGTVNLRFLVKIMAAVTPASAEVLAVRIKVQN